jgi:hypothetical protein
MDDELKVTHQIKLTYSPASKLKAGIYKIGILNQKGDNVWNCRVHFN